MDLVATFLQLAAFLALGLGLPLPSARRPATLLLALAALFSIAHGLLEPGPRTLETVHHYAGYAGSDLEVSMVAFPTGKATAPGWQWPLPFASFALLWILVLVRLGSRQPRNALLLPCLYAWSATAAWLSMQHLAAPSPVVQPAGLERFLWPAGLAAALLAARLSRGLPQLIVTLSSVVILARLPAAIFSKVASDRGLGTSLDIGDVLQIVNPVTHMLFDPPLTSGSPEQQFWLIWLEQVLVFPALHSLGLFGIALGVYLWHKHAPEEHQQAA